MQSFNQRNTLVRNSVVGSSGRSGALSAAAQQQSQQKRTSNGVVINPECDCPKCRRAARMVAKGAIGARSDSSTAVPTSSRFYAGSGGNKSRSKSPLAFKTKFFPSTTSSGANFGDVEDDYGEGDRDGPDGDPEPDQQPTKEESTTKFVLTPREMIYTAPRQKPEREQDSGRYDAGAGDCHHGVKEPCCVYCRGKLSRSRNEGSWDSARLKDRKRTAVISKTRALQPVYSTPTCTCFHEEMQEDTPRPRRLEQNISGGGDVDIEAEEGEGDEQELEDLDQEPYDEEDGDGDEELETLVKPQPQADSGNGQLGLERSHENPIRSRYRHLQQQESRLRRVPIPSRYMTDLQTRIEKSINIYVYRNGIESLPPALIHIPPTRKQSMRAVMTVIQDRMKYPIGYAKTLYKMDGTIVRHPCELELYEKYVVSSSYQKSFQAVEYGRVRSPLMVLGSESKNIHVRSKRNSYDDWRKKWKLNGLGKCLLSAEEARSREVIEKPHNVKTCIPVKLPGQTPRGGLFETKRSDVRNKNLDGQPGNYADKDNDHSGDPGQSKSGPVNWTNKSRHQELNDSAGASVGTNGGGCGDGLGASPPNSYARTRARVDVGTEIDPEYKNRRRSHWSDKFFHDPKTSKHEVLNLRPRPQPPATEPPKLKEEELLDEVTEPELVDDEDDETPFIDSRQERELKREPQLSKSYTIHGRSGPEPGWPGSALIPGDVGVNVGAAASTPCFGAFLRPNPSAAAASTDFSCFQHSQAFHMQYIPTWFQLPPPDASFPAAGWKLLESKSTSTSDIPSHACNRSPHAYRTIREREIPEIQIPFTPVQVAGMGTPTVTAPRFAFTTTTTTSQNRCHQDEPQPRPYPEARLAAAQSSPSRNSFPNKRNVATQMGTSAIGVGAAGAENQDIYRQAHCGHRQPPSQSLTKNLPDSASSSSFLQHQHQQYLSPHPQVVLLVPPQHQQQRDFFK